jgi:P-type E1-E2 ATPase
LQQVEPGSGISEIRVVPGLGLSGMLSPEGGPIVLGNERLVHEMHMVIAPAIATELENAQSRGLPMTLIGWGSRARGIFLFDEEWRPGSLELLRTLAREGGDVAILTGDHAGRGRAIEQQLGVKVEAELLPAGKVTAIRSVQTTLGPVCMVGDGINDSPALAASDVGIALGCGTDVSRDSASICLLGDDLSKIPWCIELARRTRRVIRWNLVWAFGYNSVGVACAAAGMLNPALAAFLMAASSALVTVNSLRLGHISGALPSWADDRVPGTQAEQVTIDARRWSSGPDHDPSLSERGLVVEASGR